MSGAEAESLLAEKAVRQKWSPPRFFMLLQSSRDYSYLMI